MFENHDKLFAEAKKKVRYEPIERRKSKRRHEVSDRRSEVRTDQEPADRRQEVDRRKK